MEILKIIYSNPEKRKIELDVDDLEDEWRWNSSGKLNLSLVFVRIQGCRKKIKRKLQTRIK